MPVDLTVLTALICILILGIIVIKRRLRVPRVISWMALLYAFYFIAALQARHTGYADDKVTRLFTLTALAAFVPIVVFRTRDDLRKLTNTLMIISSLIVISGMGQLTDPSVLLTRWTAGSADTVTTGAIAGIAAIGALVLCMESSGWRFIGGLALEGIAATALVAAGSKGPLLGFGLTVLAIFVLFFRNRKTALRNVAILAVIVVSAGTYVWQMMPAQSTLRLAQFFTGDVGSIADGGRGEHYKVGFNLTRNHPLGLGWGGYGDELGMGNDRYYPHNFLLETSLEAGWAACIYAFLLICASVYRLFRIALIKRSHELVMLSGFLIYCIIAAQFSGDINDNKFLFAMMSLALMSKSIYRRELLQPKRTAEEDSSL